MKKVLLIALVLTSFMFAKAQNYDTLYIQGMTNFAQYHYCANEYDGVIVYGEPNWNCIWTINSGEYIYDDHIVLLNTEYVYNVSYSAGVNRHFYVLFHSPLETSPFADPIRWKRHGETITLTVEEGEFDYYEYEYLWSNGSTEWQIETTEPGTYSVTITSIYGCGSNTFSVEVRDNVEIYRAGVDPATNKNRVLWQTTPEQATYVSSVKVERDGMVVGTVPYTNGEFLDNIGSENAARVYRITAIANDGTECPLPSYQFGTFNTIISPDIANPNLMNFSWEDPFIEEGSPYSVVAYRIGRFNENTGEFNVIDQLSANVHLGKYNMDLFDGEYGIVAAVFNDAKNRDNEELAFSNRSDSGIVGVEENGPSTGSGATRTLTVYPNPTNNVLFVETRRATSLQGETYRIMNPLGQTVMEGQITTEKQQIDVRNLPKGVYFITVGDATRKFVVE